MEKEEVYQALIIEKIRNQNLASFETEFLLGTLLDFGKDNHRSLLLRNNLLLVKLKLEKPKFYLSRLYHMLQFRWLKKNIFAYTYSMDKSYYKPEDLGKFGNITEWQEELGEKFFDYYNEVFKEGALSAREKALIALAVSHTVQCPYCIDAYTSESVKRGIEKEEMMEAVHVAAAIRGGASLVHGVQMMEKVQKLSM